MLSVLPQLFTLASVGLHGSLSPLSVVVCIYLIIVFICRSVGMSEALSLHRLCDYLCSYIDQDPCGGRAITPPLAVLF